MSSVFDKLISFSKQLLPTGRAFYVPKDGRKEKLNNALAYSEESVYNSAVGILDSILPDNNNFTVDDATRWEQRLGMIVNQSVSLDDRKLAIKRKMNHPGTILARQSAGYIQDQLQASGFNVWVHEDPNGLNPNIYFNLLSGIWEYSEDEYGTMEYGDLYLWSNVIANSIEAVNDEYFNIGGFLNTVFYIGGQVAGTIANVSSVREAEFRQLVLKLKPTQTVAYLGINYI